MMGRTDTMAVTREADMVGNSLREISMDIMGVDMEGSRDTGLKMEGIRMLEEAVVTNTTRARDEVARGSREGTVEVTRVDTTIIMAGFDGSF